jgi:hypothetical protein
MIGVAELLGLAWVPIGVAAASGMCVLLVGALATHLRSGDRLQEAAPALITLGASPAYLAAALTR